MQDTAQSIYAAGKIPRLILRFATPTIISLLVNSIYNIADQIFIGQGIGYGGNAATNIVFPVVTFTIAVTALIGDGAAAYFSLNLGRKEEREASRCVLTALILAIISGFIILTVCQITARNLLIFLSATPAILDMTLIYLRITLIGTPFVIVSTVLASLIRADGSPRYAMFCMIPGCILNIALDGLFVLVFKWGIAGAAWATVIGQIVNFIIAIAYIGRFRTVSLSLHDNIFAWITARKFLYLGIAGFINQFSGTVYTTVINHYLVKYGAMSVYGADIPLAVFGIALKINQIAMAFMNGTAVGMQPILGYNYGQKNYARAKECLKSAIRIVTVCGFIFFAIIELFPEALSGLFGQNDVLYTEFAVKCFRIFLMTAPIYGFSVVSTGLFQAIGKPIHSTFMALSRQIIYLLPLVMILTPVFGITGLLFAAPIGDIFAFSTCLVLYRREISRLNHAMQITEQ